MKERRISRKDFLKSAGIALTDGLTGCVRLQRSELLPEITQTQDSQSTEPKMIFQAPTPEANKSPTAVAKSPEQKEERLIYENKNLSYKIILPAGYKNPQESEEEFKKLSITDINWMYYYADLGRVDRFIKPVQNIKFPTMLVVISSKAGPPDPKGRTEMYLPGLAKSIIITVDSKFKEILPQDKKQYAESSDYIKPTEKDEGIKVYDYNTRVVRARIPEVPGIIPSQIDYENIVVDLAKVKTGHPWRGFEIILLTNPAATAEQQKILHNEILPNFQILNKA